MYMYTRNFTSGPFFAIFAPPFLHGNNLNAAHYLRFYSAFLLYYLGLPLALLLHLFSVYHIRFYALDVVFLVFFYFSDNLRKAAHFILICENPQTPFLNIRNYVGMRAVSFRSTSSAASATVSGGSFATYSSLLHCVFDLALWFEHFESVRNAINSASDDKDVALPLFRTYEGRGNATPSSTSFRSCYEAVASGAKKFSDYPPFPNFSYSVFLFFVSLSFGFLFFWWLIDTRSFERATGLRLSKYLTRVRRLIKL